MLKIDNLYFHYKCGREILHDVGFSVNPGQFKAILGNNGVGKSTLLKCLNHILRPEKGSVQLHDENILEMCNRDVARRIAFVSQSVPSTEVTVHDFVMLGRRPYMKWSFTEEDHNIIHSAMNRLGIEHLKGCFISELSGGERQKVMLARALSQQPEVLLLDEPTSSLDLANQHHVLKLVRELCDKDSFAAVIVIHDINLALRYCDSFLLLKDGEVYADGGIEVLNADHLKAVYGIDAEIVEVRGHKIILMD
ncbi:ABC transporter ATP-binding protein [Mogibacterium timidum]|uniref:ABC transporter ATP-binding protein n=1 Tax=Mogibacterium timidum TaxID=35519 RepID=A0A7Y8VSU9_9FIRM|nr:ABC transporter ATP-binding protein [Mogibacterium timidum]NWO24016.1 ABC transporter ATP-binding protein [Mogibacterium timidum]